jgi:ATP-dependent exoDNAse (exonuclease V) beta subunit
MESEQAWEMDENKSGRLYGNLLHELLAQLAQPSDVDELLADYLYQGKIYEAEVRNLSEELNEIMTSSAMKPFFKSGLSRKREATLITQSGQILRPDLVVFFEDHWAVIDYKTGEKNEIHQQQLMEYVNALQQITTLPVEAHLYYTTAREMEQVV